jgi:hypothetical protein
MHHDSTIPQTIKTKNEKRKREKRKSTTAFFSMKKIEK